MIIIRITATRVHKSSRAGLSSCAYSTCIAIRPDSCLEFLGHITIQEIIVIAFGHCLQMLNPEAKLCRQEILKYLIFLGPQWQTTKLICSQPKNAQRNPVQEGTIVRHQLGWKTSTSFSSSLSCKNYHGCWDMGNCGSSPVWYWVKRYSHIFTMLFGKIFSAE